MKWGESLCDGSPCCGSPLQRVPLAFCRSIWCAPNELPPAGRTVLTQDWAPNVFFFFSQHVCEAEEREEVVVCELCEASVANFNQHMKKNHPGCGRSANRQGYRSNGSYVDGWFGGECGSGNPYYLLCGGCREKYLSVKTKTKVPMLERSASPGLRGGAWTPISGSACFP